MKENTISSRNTTDVLTQVSKLKTNVWTLLFVKSMSFSAEQRCFGGM